jgi:hypothetical protein
MTLKIINVTVFFNSYLAGHAGAVMRVFLKFDML